MANYQIVAGFGGSVISLTPPKSTTHVQPYDEKALEILWEILWLSHMFSRIHTIRVQGR